MSEDNLAPPDDIVDELFARASKNNRRKLMTKMEIAIAAKDEEIALLRKDLAERNIDVIGADAVTDMAADKRRIEQLSKNLKAAVDLLECKCFAPGVTCDRCEFVKTLSD